MVRRFGGSTPEVVWAQAKLRVVRQVDRVMTAEVRFAGGHTGRIHCLMWSADLPRLTVKVVGDRGELRLHPLIPFQRFSVRSGHRKAGGAFSGAPHHLWCQLDAFAAAVLRGEPVKTTPQEAIGEHDRHRRDVSRRRADGASTRLNHHRFAHVGVGHGHSGFNLRFRNTGASRTTPATDSPLHA